MLSRKLCLLLALAACSALAPLAAQNPPAVPEPLRPWIPWVLEKHPDLTCPLLDGARLCAWPGRLALDLDERGGTFELKVAVDRQLDLPLPGHPAHWPREVSRDGRPALLRRLGDQPAVALAPGLHRVAGRFRWSRLPESLPVPRQIALLDLRLNGAAVRSPRREDDGLLWLARSRQEEGEQDRLGLEVERLVEDGVPVALTTHLRLRVSGSSRAVDLGSPLLPGFALTGLSGELPLRWTESQRLVVQVRPGTWTVAIEARSLGPVSELPLGERPEPWPEEETWAFQADASVRAVRVSGAPGIDPQRTSLPEEWKSLPAYRLGPGAALVFEVLRRGEPQPPPDAVEIRRLWWLEQSGEQIAVFDRLTGELFQGGRLEALAPAQLGRLALITQGTEVTAQLITASPDDAGRAGAEIRTRDLEVQAELLYPRGGPLPAAGWNRDARSLVVNLGVPPGWTLLAAPGADQAAGAWVDRWTLLDLFLLLILTLATWRLDGRLWGLLAFFVLGLAWHEPRFTALWAWWLFLLPLRALLGVLPAEKARWVRGLRRALLVGFAVQLLVFVADQWRTGLFPQLESLPPGLYSSGLIGQETYPASAPAAVDQAMEKEPEAVVPEEPKSSVRRRYQPSAKDPRILAAEVDPNAVVQTGPGIPSWQWRMYGLSWQGPVKADQKIRLWLVSPKLDLLLSLLRIAGAVLVGWCLLDPRKTPGAALHRETAPAAAAAALLLLVLVPGRAEAQEAPPVDVLAELETRLTTPPECHPACVEVPRLRIEASAAGLRLEADVHAAAPTAWRLPGPAAAWTPARVSVDGQRATALRLGDDGFFLLRLEPGVHRVEITGSARSSLALEFPLRPRTLEWRGDGWTLDGWRGDEPPPGAVRLDRQLELAEAPADTADVGFEPEPWLELSRELDIGLPWLVHSELRRRGPAGTVVLARVPLLPGESVTTGGVTVEDGEALVSLEPDETVRRFESTLEETSTVELVAPEDRPWLERWELRCSPIWHCAAEGLAPARHMQDGAWRPLWQPWPGERVTLSFIRPQGAAGRTTTYDRVRLVARPGRRLLEAELTLELRTSQGGEQTLVLPDDAALQSLTVDGKAYPARPAEGRVAFTVEPGTHKVEAAWRQDHGTGLVERVPEVEIGGEAVDVTVRVELARNRWLLWAGGPGWGPVVQFWQYLIVLALAAVALGRWVPSPLRVRDWLLLLAGLTQVPLAAAAVVVGWLLMLALRHRFQARRWYTYDGVQLALIGVGLAALIVLYVAIHSGLLIQPDMQVLAPGNLASSSSNLEWYVDRSDASLPRPWVLSLPLWVWRILMLLWSLWLASRLLRWAPWCWERLTPGPLLATPEGFARWRKGPEDDGSG